MPEIQRGWIEMMTDVEIDEVVKRAEIRIDAMWRDPNHEMWDWYFYQTSIRRSHEDAMARQALRTRGGEFNGAAPEGAD